MPKIQFSVTQEQMDFLSLKAKQQGLNVGIYCKQLIFPDSVDTRKYQDLYDTMCNTIKSLPTGTEFSLRDIISSPPARLGRDLWTLQDELHFKWVKKLHKVNVFMKE